MTPPLALELVYSLRHRLGHAAIHGTLLLASVILIGFSHYTKRPDLVVPYRWGALVIAVWAIGWAILEWRRISKPALAATQEGVLLANGSVLEWGLFRKLILVKIDGSEWLGFRFRTGVFKGLDAEQKEALRQQDGWLMARLACAFETKALRLERTQAMERVAALSRLPVEKAAREIRY